MGGVIETTEDGEVIRCIDPRDGQTTQTVPCTPSTDIPQLVAAARDAQTRWWDVGLKRRRWAVADLHQGFLRQADRIVALLGEECGRPAGEAWTSEVLANSDLFKYWLGHIDDLLTPQPVALNPINYPRKRALVRLEPVGVVGLITPWNLPMAIPLRAIVPAILAGNTVVFKPSEHSPRTGALLAELFQDALPDGVVTVIQGGAAQGRALVQAHPDLLVFTGSVPTGRAIARQAGEQMMPTSLELGGKDAALVLADADLDRAAAGITWGAFHFAGQDCSSIERCFVHRSVYDDLLARIITRTQALRPMVDVGPLITATQLAIVKDQVSQALAQGATARCGGRAPGPGLYHEPTVLTEVTDQMQVMHQETFGPVLPIVPYDDVQDAIDAINATDYGLTTSVWTRDLELGESMASSLDCGVVTVNNHSMTGALPDAAWSGTRATGHGVTNSRWALNDMVRPRTILVDAVDSPRELWWYPYNQALAQVASGMIELSRQDGRRLRGVRTALSGLINRWKV